MIPQRIIRAVQEPSLQYHKHRQSQDSLLIAFSSVQGEEKEGGGGGGRRAGGDFLSSSEHTVPADNAK